MKLMRTSAALMAMAMLQGGCSTRPRNFSASLAQPVTDRVEFEQDYRTCQTLARAGRTNGFKAAAAQGLASGAGVVGGGALVTGLGAGVNVGTGAASASFAAVPVIGILAGFGVSRMIRSGRESKFKRAMTSCLAEYGYSVEGWSKLHKRKDAASEAAHKVSVAQSAPAPTASAQTVAEVLVTESPDAIERVGFAVP